VLLSGTGGKNSLGRRRIVTAGATGGGRGQGGQRVPACERVIVGCEELIRNKFSVVQLYCTLWGFSKDGLRMASGWISARYRKMTSVGGRR